MGIIQTTMVELLRALLVIILPLCITSETFFIRHSSLWHWNGCSKSKPCGVGQGDCDGDNECKAGLKCGLDNCRDFDVGAHPKADCCVEGVDSVKWVLAPRGKGDCEKICALWGWTCDESMGRKAASSPNSVDFKGVGCKGRNAWDYGQGFSKCLDKGCCGDSSCQYHCSAPSRWPGCKVADGFASGHHGRFCPCSGCPAGWVRFKSSCYKVFSATRAGWMNAEAEIQCRENGGHLASIHSKEENDFVTSLDSGVMWLGGYDNTEGSWRWSDGSTFSFTNWGCGEPYRPQSNEDCMTTNERCGGKLGLWNDINCSTFITKFVCKKSTG